jgi:hypothetical protein
MLVITSLTDPSANWSSLKVSRSCKRVQERVYMQGRNTMNRKEVPARTKAAKALCCGGTMPVTWDVIAAG